VKKSSLHYSVTLIKSNLKTICFSLQIIRPRSLVIFVQLFPDKIEFPEFLTLKISQELPAKFPTSIFSLTFSQSNLPNKVPGPLNPIQLFEIICILKIVQGIFQQELIVLTTTHLETHHAS